MVPVNPPAQRLGRENAVLSGCGARYYVPDFEGCLSIKSVVNGTAVWETERRRFLLNEDRWLILNDRQRYTITIDALRLVTTFCLFFERGFVEELYRAQVAPSGVLLDLPQPARTGTVEFISRIEPSDGSVIGFLKRFQTELVEGRMSRVEWEERFLRIAGMLVQGRSDTVNAIARLPAVRHSTCVEVYRRLLRGRDFLLSSLDEPIRLKDMAAAACLSPFHFHRVFRRAFGETPHRYLTRHRLERAAQLLGRAELSVTEICLATGFESLTSFSDLFRRHYGLPPSKFSKIQQAQHSTSLAGHETEYAQLSERAWTLYKRLGLVLDRPHVALRGADEKGRAYFVEVFTWKSSDAPEDVPAEVKAIWVQFEAACEVRDGRPGIDFSEVTAIQVD